MVDSRPEDDFPPGKLAAIERTTREVGQAVFNRLEGSQPGILERRWWDDRVMSWAMQDEVVKVQLFRFIDALPTLKSSESVTRHLQEYFGEVRDRLPTAVRMGVMAARPGSILGRAVAQAARRNALGHARRFIAGTNVEEVLQAARRARRERLAFTLDILGEAVTSEPEADAYVEQVASLIRGVSPTVNAWPEEPQLDREPAGELPRVNVSVKLSAMDSQFDPLDFAGTIERVSRRLRPLLRLAQEHRAHLHVDMESYRCKDLTLAIFKQVLLEPEFRDQRNVGIVIQAYLRDAGRDLRELCDWARQRKRSVWVRLVKGAYWDYETVHALSQGWPVPVFQEKWQSDANFERLTRFLFLNREQLRPALASHNIRSLAHGIAIARHLGLSTTDYELQMLYGMADVEKRAFARMGHRVRIYMPYGELIPGMAYLVRRLLENTSNDSFLRASFTEHVSPEVLLMSPLEQKPEPPPAAPAISIAPHPPAARVPGAGNFANEPMLDFALAENRHKLHGALSDVKAQFGLHEPLVYGGREIETATRLESWNPSHRRQLVGTAAAADKVHVDEAVAASRAAYHGWSKRPVEQRAGILRDAAGLLCARRFELAAWIVHECGKTWREADGDVAEAVDFCEYYALCSEALQGSAVDVPGEENRFNYRPRGVAAVIAPWNFPLAILVGMSAAALVTGNTVILKPAEQASLVAARWMEILEDAGVPPGVVGYLPGKGEVVGAALVEHPDVAVIAFTGSRAVGLSIHARAAQVSAQSCTQVKRVIAEMGGKNAILIDDDADLDEAVLGVIKSAFGHQGQKCSACSRCIVLETVLEPFLKRLADAAKSLKLGPAEDPATSVGPLIDAESYRRVREYIEAGRSEGRLVAAIDPGPLADEGWYVGPHIFAEVSPRSRLAQEEIFGPVLVVMGARDLDEALRIANGTQYALTGGVYSRSPANIDRVREEFDVGNLYINRPITGALVARQPFGGFRMSGIGSQAGGPDYLLQFVIPRTITENTLRRGFAPPAAPARIDPPSNPASPS